VSVYRVFLAIIRGVLDISGRDAVCYSRFNWLRIPSSALSNELKREGF
jgi:hypothetical protein